VIQRALQKNGEQASAMARSGHLPLIFLDAASYQTKHFQLGLVTHSPNALNNNNTERSNHAWKFFLQGPAMIARDEFDQRVSHWFGLLMTALEENVRRLISEGKDFRLDDMDNPKFAAAMRKAVTYQAEYLSDEILEYFRDSLLPRGYLENTSRLEFLLQQALILKTAQMQAEHCIKRARQNV
jgi:hypothetical protein